MLHEDDILKKFPEIHRKKSVLESLFDEVELYWKVYTIYHLNGVKYVIKSNLYYFLTWKPKRKQPYLFTLDKTEEKQMDFDWNYLFDKFQPSQLVCTRRSERWKIGCSRKTVCANYIQRVYRVCRASIMQ